LSVSWFRNLVLGVTAIALAACRPARAAARPGTRRHGL